MGTFLIQQNTQKEHMNKQTNNQTNKELFGFLFVGLGGSGKSRNWQWGMMVFEELPLAGPVSACVCVIYPTKELG